MFLLWFVIPGRGAFTADRRTRRAQGEWDKKIQACGDLHSKKIDRETVLQIQSRLHLRGKVVLIGSPGGEQEADGPEEAAVHF